MLNVKLIEPQRIALLEPIGELSDEDFDNACKKIDPFIEKNGKLFGLIIHVKVFPGWENFAGFTRHLKFVRDHHKKVARVALVTDSSLGEIAEYIGKHFVKAEIKNFAFDELNKACDWISSLTPEKMAR